MNDEDTDTARSTIEEAVLLDDSVALGHFALGKVHERLQAYPAARKAYLAAKDRDLLRFRAPEAFNGIIRELAATHGARVVDVQAAFLESSTHGIIGNDLMLEHLHPNLDGYFLLADAFYESLRNSGVIEPWSGTVPRERARKDIPVTEVEQLKGEYEIIRLLADWPFQSSRINPDYPPRKTDIEHLAWRYFRDRLDWREAMEQLQSLYAREKDIYSAARVAVLLANAYPYEADLQYTASGLALAVEQPDEAARLLRRAQQRDRKHPEKFLATLQWACSARKDESMRQCLERLREFATDFR